MGKTNQNLRKSSTAKATIPNTISKAIDAVCKISGRTDADIVREALEFYLKQRHPELLPKTELEITNNAKAKYQEDKFYKQYASHQNLIESIPRFEEFLTKFPALLKETNKEIEDVEGQLRDRKSTRLNSSHPSRSRMPSSA